MRNLTRVFLQKLGYKVLDASFPGEAIQMAQQFTGTIDLLLTDVVMPGMNGRELASQLQPFYANMRVLYMSGFANQTLEKDGPAANDAFMQKPFVLQELAARIRELLRSHGKLSTGKRIRGLVRRAQTRLPTYLWPGNIRVTLTRHVPFF